MALQFILSGLGLDRVIGIAGFLPVIRNVEDLLPDHEQSPQAVEAPAQLVDSPVLA